RGRAGRRMTSAPAWGNMSALEGTRTPNLLIRRSGQVVQDRPPWSVRWADIPELYTCVGRRPVAWLQSWLQVRWDVGDSPVLRRPGLPRLSRSCPCPGRGRCVKAHEATAQRLVLDSVGSVEIIVYEEDEGLS